MEHIKDGRSWVIGGAEDAAWIVDATSPGATVTTAIPAQFAAYALVVEPDETHEPDPAATAHREQAVVDVLRRQSADQDWWLGYLGDRRPRPDL